MVTCIIPVDNAFNACSLVKVALGVWVIYVASAGAPPAEVQLNAAGLLPSVVRTWPLDPTPVGRVKTASVITVAGDWRAT